MDKDNYDFHLKQKEVSLNLASLLRIEESFLGNFTNVRRGYSREDVLSATANTIFIISQSHTNASTNHLRKHFFFALKPQKLTKTQESFSSSSQNTFLFYAYCVSSGLPSLSSLAVSRK